ncbi:MAG: hypothetical protein AAB373_00420 [Patescibacteria group bacterium]
MAENPSELIKIRPVHESDATGLVRLYQRLDSCNGDVAQIREIIKDSRQSLMSPRFQSMTLVAEALDENLNSKGIAATARLILLGEDDPDHAPLMYEETQQGLELTRRSSDPSLEMAGMVTLPECEGRGIGKALAAVRALIARRFNGVTGTDKILVEFLPQYDDSDSKENAFWRDLILSHLMQNGTLEQAMNQTSEMSKQPINNANELLKVLLKADVRIRNTIVKKYFPALIPGDKISAAARQVTGDVGRETKGALVNLQRIYGSGTFTQTGTFPIDGGPNYETAAIYGALGDRTVRTVYTDQSAEDARIMAETPERLIVWAPQSPTQAALRNSSWVMTPGIIGSKTVKLPHTVSSLTNIASGEETSAFKLPISSSKRT